jgi:hypothetical protein
LTLKAFCVILQTHFTAITFIVIYFKEENRTQTTFVYFGLFVDIVFGLITLIRIFLRDTRHLWVRQSTKSKATTFEPVPI